MKLYMVFPSVEEVTEFNWLILRIQESIIRFLPVPADVPWKLVMDFSDLGHGQGTLTVSVTEGNKLKAKTMNGIPFTIIGGCSMYQFIALLNSELTKLLFSSTEGKVRGCQNKPPSSIAFWNAFAAEENYQASLARFRESIGNAASGPEKKETCPDCGHQLEPIGITFACPQCTTQWFQG